jgi:hypothetical protein
VILSLPIPGISAAYPVEPQGADGESMTESAATITATFSAPPVVSAQRHHIVAAGYGLVGLTAIKVLKFAQLNITDALVFVTGMAAHTASRLVAQAAQWTPGLPAVVMASVLVALVVAAAIDIVKIITALPDSGRSTQSDDAKGLVLRHMASWHSRQIAKGLV